MSVFFGGEFFGSGFFQPLPAQPEPDAHRGGKGDNGRRRNIFKPTGLLPRRRTERKTVEERVAETREIHAEVAQEAERAEAREESEPQTPIAQMSLADIEREIGALLRKELRTQDEEIALMLLLCALAV